MPEDINGMPESDLFQEFGKSHISKLIYTLNENELDAFYQVVTTGLSLTILQKWL